MPPPLTEADLHAFHLSLFTSANSGRPDTPTPITRAPFSKTATTLLDPSQDNINSGSSSAREHNTHRAPNKSIDYSTMLETEPGPSRLLLRQGRQRSRSDLAGESSWTRAPSAMMVAATNRSDRGRRTRLSDSNACQNGEETILPSTATRYPPRSRKFALDHHRDRRYRISESDVLQYHQMHAKSPLAQEAPVFVPEPNTSVIPAPASRQGVSPFIKLQQPKSKELPQTEIDVLSQSQTEATVAAPRGEPANPSAAEKPAAVQPRQALLPKRKGKRRSRVSESDVFRFHQTNPPPVTSYVSAEQQRAKRSIPTPLRAGSRSSSASASDVIPTSPLSEFSFMVPSSPLNEIRDTLCSTIWGGRSEKRLRTGPGWVVHTPR